MSSIMRARSGLMGRGEPSEVMGLSRAEGCWTFDAWDRMPRQSRATAHPPTKRADRDACSLPRAGSFFGALRSLPEASRGAQWGGERLFLRWRTKVKKREARS